MHPPLSRSATGPLPGFALRLLFLWILAGPACADVAITHTVTNSWGTGYNGEVKLQNNGPAVVSGWTVSFDFPGTITNLWNGTILSHTGTQYIVRDAGHNASIAVGGSAAFGFTADPATPTQPPVNFLLNSSSGLSIADAAATEGDAGTKTLTFTVSRAGATTGAVSVVATTAGGTATSGGDFVALTQTINFAAGESIKHVAVTINGDTQEEPDETFIVTLSSATGGAAISRAVAIGKIQNDDVMLHASVADISLYEGDTGTAAAAFTISLDRPAAQTVSLQAAAAAGTAQEDADFTALTQTVNFAAGEQQKTVSVAVTGDSIEESKETFTLQLTNPSPGLAIDRAQATCSIYDNDNPNASVVVLNEISAQSSVRALRWSADGTPGLGMGTPWHSAGYNDAAWSSGGLPAGYGVSGLTTNVGTAMSGRTPSLYLRKEFTVTADQAASTGTLRLQVEYDDGFIAFLNGVEIARANMGPPKHFVYASQEAYNARPTTAMVELNAGSAAARLVAGTNILAIQAHNALTDPAANNFAMTPTFRINAGLRVEAAGAAPAATFISYGAAGGAWRFFVGLAEPSGGIFDPVLLTGNFTPPAGQEEDFEEPEEFSDWVELRNNSAASVDLSNWSLTDNEAQPGKWHFPAGTLIPANGYLLVLCDDREEANGFTTLAPRTLITPGSIWKHFSTGGDPGASWTDVTFNDTGWAAGIGPLGYSPNNEDGAATIIANGQNTHITDYFRREFTVTDPAVFSGVLTMRFLRDDGLVIYLNGAEVRRDNMPEGVAITAATLALTNVADEGSWVTVSIPASGLLPGKNVIAAELHQNSTGSSDARFDLDLSGHARVAGAPVSMLHAGFSLDGGGEYLGLHDAGGGLRDELITWPKQQPFLTWGRSAADQGLWGFVEASPGTPNAGTPLPGRVAQPDFLKADAAGPGGYSPLVSGFYTGAQTLVLRSATPGAVIRYTTNGSEPLETGNGITYSAPVSLTAPNDKTAVIVRAKAFKSGLLPSADGAKTYLINQNTGLRAMPVLSLTGDAGRCFFLPMGVMSISGGSWDSNTLWQPGTADSYNVPQHHGAETEREISAELIFPDGRPGFRDDVGLRMAGSAYGRPRYRFQQTAQSPWNIWEPKEKGSFNLVWRDDYGAKDLDYELFPGWPVRTFRQLRLRAGSNDTINPFIIDEFMRRLLGELGHDSLRGTFVMLYINGSFKGIYNVCERLRNDTFQRHFHSDNDFDVKYNNEFSAGDSTAWTAFRNTYNKDLSIAANYSAVSGAADLTNIADYYLLNIYANTWDWATWQAGANNYVLYRERIPSAKWRFTVWDGEGSFNHQSYFAQPPSFNIITNHLTGTDDTNELSTVWQRLAGVAPFTGVNIKGNAEFRLLMADRIHKHFFNGGVLDDRVSTNRVRTLKEELKAMVRTGVTYLNNAFRDDWFDTWIHPSTGRRAYLLGPAATQFRDAGVWPATTPPVFSQHGGSVPAGFALTMTGPPAGGTLYYTLDGSDPRLAGGSVSGAALTYIGAVALDRVTTVKARIRSGAGEWSALTEAEFTVPTAAPSAQNLVISEFMYHPPPTSAADEAAGFTDRDDFEFIRLTNIGASPVDLTPLRFSAGVTFDFSAGAVKALNPGASVLVVKRADAFALRYGSGFTVAGAFAGNLSNAGELLTLSTTLAPEPLRTLTYSDRAPWPAAGDAGSSLLLVNPPSAPDHALPQNWAASAHPGGLGQALTFAQWQLLSFSIADAANAGVSGPLADPDGDGIPNRAEWALGSHPQIADLPPLTPGVMEIAGQTYFSVSWHFVPSASGAAVTVQSSASLQSWQNAAADLVTVSQTPPGTDGRVLVTMRLAQPLSAAAPRSYLRLAVQ